MFTVADIASDAKRVLANCDTETLLNRLNYVVELLANEADWDPLLGVVDIPTSSATERVSISLPREVETVLSLNIDSRPAKARNRFFTFHLNGPGDSEYGECGWVWDDKGDYPTVVDLTANARLAAYADVADADVEIWAYGYDDQDRWLRTLVGTEWVDGIPVPVYTDGSLPPATPVIRRITRIRKGLSTQYMQLKSYAVGGTDATLLGDYAPNEYEPSYRRILLDRPATTVRIIFRRSVFKFESVLDIIPLQSPFAILMALKAFQKMEDDQFDEGEKYMALAVKALTKEQLSRNPVVTPEIQVRGPLITNPRDRLE